MHNFWHLVPKAKIKNTFVSALVAESDFFNNASEICHPQHLFKLLLIYWEYFTVSFLLLRHSCPSHSFNFNFIFFCIFHMKEGCNCSLIAILLRIRSKILNLNFLHYHNRNVNESTIQTIWRDRLSRLSTDKTKFCFNTRTKSLLPIYSVFIRTRQVCYRSSSFLLKKITKVGNPKTRKCSVCLVLEWSSKILFQRAATTCTRV